MRVTIRPVFDSRREIDVTRAIIAAIAEELWNCYGGNDVVNWLEAEVHLERMVRGDRKPQLPSIVADSRARSGALQQRLEQGARTGERGKPRVRRSRVDHHGRRTGHRSSRRTPQRSKPWVR